MSYWLVLEGFILVRQQRERELFKSIIHDPGFSPQDFKPILQAVSDDSFDIEMWQICPTLYSTSLTTVFVETQEKYQTPRKLRITLNCQCGRILPSCSLAAGGFVWEEFQRLVWEELSSRITACEHKLLPCNNKFSPFGNIYTSCLGKYFLKSCFPFFFFYVLMIIITHHHSNFSSCTQGPSTNPHFGPSFDSDPMKMKFLYF